MVSTPRKYVAFLRAINVGGRVVKMDALRSLFQAIPLGGVETFIASGNVVFHSAAADIGVLERRIEKKLSEALGYEVDTYVRSTAELARVALQRPFGVVEPAHNLLVGFLGSEPTEAAREAVAALRTPVDEFVIDGRELYWLCRGRQSDTQVTGPRLARALGMETTVRKMNTIERLVAKYPDE